MTTRQTQTRAGGNSNSMPLAAVISTSSTIEERLRLQAYLLFEKRQHASVPGDAVSDWLRAERILDAKARQLQNTRRV
jgi:hypothetical protein